MKRTPIQRRPIEWPTGPDRSAEFASHTMTKPIARLLTSADTARHNPVAQKTPERKSRAIRESARGEECQVRLPGCDGGVTTVWCHLPEAVAGRGMGLKGIDVLGFYGCRNCHDIADRRVPRPDGLTAQDVALMVYRALARSVVILAQKGLV